MTKKKANPAAGNRPKPPRTGERKRLNKYLSLCGLGSRRSVEMLILGGRIVVNGAYTRDLSTTVGDDDSVTMDGRPLIPADDRVYIMMNKPGGFITTVRDDRLRKTVMDLLPDDLRNKGIYPVGRLDLATGGILILTNDGDLAFRLTRPEFGVKKEYTVVLDRPLQEADRVAIEKGVYLPDLQIKTREAVVRFDRDRSKIRILIHEGKNRQIRRIFDCMGYRIRSLVRTAYADLRVGTLGIGAWRHLTRAEVSGLQECCRKQR